MGRMVLPSLDPRTLLTSMRQHLQITPPLPTTVLNYRPSRHMMREPESTSLLTTLKYTPSPSDWEIWGVLSWRPNPVRLDLTGSTVTCWNTSLRAHKKSSKRSRTTSGSLLISLLNGERQLWSPSPNQIRTMINKRFIWYLEKYGILDKSQCGFRKHRSTMDHLVSLERYVWDAFARKQQAVGLLFHLEKAYETTWQYGIIHDLHRIGLRGRLPVFVSEYLRDSRIRVRIGTTLWWILSRRSTNWWCPGCYML